MTDSKQNGPRTSTNHSCFGCCFLSTEDDFCGETEDHDYIHTCTYPGHTGKQDSYGWNAPTSCPFLAVKPLTPFKLPQRYSSSGLRMIALDDGAYVRVDELIPLLGAAGLQAS